MAKQAYQQPHTLKDVYEELSKLHTEVMSDRSTIPQVAESANVLGKMIGASKAHLEACKINKVKVKGDWAKIILGQE